MKACGDREAFQDCISPAGFDRWHEPPFLDTPIAIVVILEGGNGGRHLFEVLEDSAAGAAMAPETSSIKIVTESDSAYGCARRKYADFKEIDHKNEQIK
jgi:hypothetical protein